VANFAQSIDDAYNATPEVKTIRAHYVNDSRSREDGEECIKEGCDNWLQQLTTNAVYPLVCHDPLSPVGTSVLFKKRRLDETSDICFGLTSATTIESLVWPSILVNGEIIPIIVLEDTNDILRGDVIVFAFAAPIGCHVVPLGRKDIKLGDYECHVSGFKLKDNISRNVFSIISKEAIKKIYYSDFSISERPNFERCFSSSPEFRNKKNHGDSSKELVLNQFTLEKSMMGSPVVSSQGYLVGIIKCGLTNSRSIAIDLRPIAKNIVEIAIGGY
jgi:hypothetical protein